MGVGAGAGRRHQRPGHSRPGMAGRCYRSEEAPRESRYYSMYECEYSTSTVRVQYEYIQVAAESKEKTSFLYSSVAHDLFFFVKSNHLTAGGDPSAFLARHSISATTVVRVGPGYSARTQPLHAIRSHLYWYSSTQRPVQ
jgi:hypothetical protein